MIDIDLTLQKQNFDAAIALTTEVVQKHTGYQQDLLTPDAEFETDLGVDSIVQMDIFVELMERCGLPVNGEQLASVISIRDLTLKALSRLEGRPLPLPQVAELHSKSQPVEELQELIESNASATLEENPSPLTDTRTMRDFADLPNRDLFHKVGAFHEFYTQKRDAGHYWYGMPLESPARTVL